MPTSPARRGTGTPGGRREGEKEAWVRKTRRREGEEKERGRREEGEREGEEKEIWELSLTSYCLTPCCGHRTTAAVVLPFVWCRGRPGVGRRCSRQPSLSSWLFPFFDVHVTPTDDDSNSTFFRFFQARLRPPPQQEEGGVTRPPTPWLLCSGDSAGYEL